MPRLERFKPYRTTLNPGVRQAVSRYAPHLKHIEVGTVLEDGKERLVYINRNTIIEMATLICINNEVVVKFGLHVTFGQVNAIRLVSERTSVPVPTVLGYYEDDKGCKYIVTEYIRGCNLDSVWGSLSTRQKQSFANQLKPMYEELHSMKETYIGGVGRNPPEGRRVQRNKGGRAVPERT